MALYRVSLPSECRFSLNMPNEAFFFVHEEMKVAIQIEQVPSARFVSYAGMDLNWLHRDGEAYRITAVKDGRREEILKIHCGDHALGMVGGGYIQPLIFSFFVIYVESDDSRFVEKEDLFKEWLGSCLERFYINYSIVSSEAEVDTLSLAGVPIVNVMVSDDYTFDCNSIGGEFRFLKRIISWDETSRTGHLKEDLSAERVRELKDALAEDLPVMAHMRLLLQAKRQAIKEHYFDLSIISSQTAFELFCGLHLKSLCQLRGVSHFDKRRSGRVARIPLNDFVERENVGEIISKITEVSGYDFKGTAEHANWKKIAYEKRNLIVHRGWSSATMDDARNAFESVNEYINLLVRSGGVAY